MPLVGALREATTGRRVTLTGRVVIGRSHAARLRLSGRTVSSEHAVLWWHEGWMLRDLGSRNGTFVDGDRLEAGQERRLAEGSVLRFGTDSGQWVLSSVSPPVAAARCESTGDEVVAEDGILCLPSPDDPVRMIFVDPDGAWVAEDERVREPVADDQLLVIHDRPWRLMLPEDHRATWQAGSDEPGVQELLLSFEVSSDEEFVKLEVERGGKRTVLDPRAHHYLLLTLARRRVEDAEAPPAQRGWIHRDDVMRMLMMDPQHLNVQIFRARQQFRQVGVTDAVAIVERRSGTGQLRIGAWHIQISRL